jgi:hypothetical protein
MITEDEAKVYLQQRIDVGFKHFCPDCLSGLEQTKEGTYYCPNEMCLNEEHYEADQ